MEGYRSWGKLIIHQSKSKLSLLDATFTSGALVFKVFQQKLFILFPEVPDFFVKFYVKIWHEELALLQTVKTENKWIKKKEHPVIKGKE